MGTLYRRTSFNQSAVYGDKSSTARFLWQGGPTRGGHKLVRAPEKAMSYFARNHVRYDR